MVVPPGQRYAPWPAAGLPPHRPSVAPQAPPQGRPAPATPPVARAKPFDDPPPPAPAPAPVWSAALTLPSPEQLGITAAPPTPPPAHESAPVDWNATHAHLSRLGAVGVQLGRFPQGGYRFAFLLPTGRPDVTRHIEGVGATEAEAVRRALANAEQ